jgi:hypothetical protein
VIPGLAALRAWWAGVMAPLPPVSGPGLRPITAASGERILADGGYQPAAPAPVGLPPDQGTGGKPPPAAPALLVTQAPPVPSAPPAAATLAARLRAALMPPPPGPEGRPKLAPEDYTRAATSIVASVPQVKAFVMTEVGAGGGFLADGTGRARILFEAYRFSKNTKGGFDQKVPSLSSPSWDRSLYQGGAAEWDRLARAAALDAANALRSASYGLGQVMGENCTICGWDDVFSFVADMHTSEGRQLDAMIGYVRGSGLAAAVRQVSANAETCRAAARGYNGAGYEANGYHVKLAANFALIIGASVPASIKGMLWIGATGPQVRKVQDALNRAGQVPRLSVDGVFGATTQAAVTAFQAARRLQPDGVVGPATAAALGI